MFNHVFGRFKPAFVKDDLKSGFLVFLIALPLCLGIAMASGFPAISGIITAAVGGLVVSFLGSSPLTIKGPAAGLIVIVIASVQDLGQGDAYLGYKRTLAVGVIAACLQIIFAMLKLASVGIAISPAVVHGMLASIGVIIISKQIHTVFGVIPTAKHPLELLAEIPHSLMSANPEILFIGGLSLLLLFALPLIKNKWLKSIPAPLIVLSLAVPLALFFGLDTKHMYNFMQHNYEVGPNLLLNLPGNILNALAFPDFSQSFSFDSIKYIVMLSLVGSIESTLSVLAVDAMDSKKRSSDLNRDLFALGIGNLICSIIGGLPMISEIVRSKANIDAKAQSHFSNFFHGVFLVLFVVLAPTLLHQIPLAALAAMLVFTGSRLASFKEFIHMKNLGYDQLFLFCATIIVTLATDLLVGVTAGIALKIGLHALRGASIRNIFWPKIDSQIINHEMILTIHSVAAFTSLLAVQRTLKNMPENIKKVVIDCSSVLIIDHTFLTRISSIVAKWPQASLEIIGINHLTPRSLHPHSARVGRAL